MTHEYFSTAYQKGFQLTLRFLLSRGISHEIAVDTAQAAWARGWEKRAQLQHPELLLTWTNTIALNIYRSLLRRESPSEPLPEMESAVNLNVAAIDVERILMQCKPNDRKVLENHYILGFKAREIAKLQGCSESAVRLRLLRARRKIQRHVIDFKRQAKVA